MTKHAAKACWHRESAPDPASKLRQVPECGYSNNRPTVQCQGRASHPASGRAGKKQCRATEIFWFTRPRQWHAGGYNIPSSPLEEWRGH